MYRLLVENYKLLHVIGIGYSEQQFGVGIYFFVVVIIGILWIAFQLPPYITKKLLKLYYKLLELD